MLHERHLIREQKHIGSRSGNDYTINSDHHVPVDDAHPFVDPFPYATLSYMAEGAQQLPTNNANTAELSSSSVIPIGADTRIAQQPQDNWWLPTFPAMVTLLVGWAILGQFTGLWFLLSVARQSMSLRVEEYMDRCTRLKSRRKVPPSAAVERMRVT